MPKHVIQQNTPAFPARAILIGLILLPLNAYWITIASDLWSSLIGMTGTSLFFSPVFNLFLLILVNLALQKFAPKLSFSRSELLTVYVMLVMLSTVGGTRMMSFLVGVLTYPYWFATTENEYAELFHRYIPSWFTVSDKKLLRGFFEGEESFYTAEYIEAWLTPMIVWSAIIFAIFFIFLCFNIILRKQWTEQDKLSYPIVQIPLELTAPRATTRPLFWTGFAVSAFIQILNGLNYLNPAIPGLPMHNFANFTEKPWDALGWMKFSFYPFVIGLTYFVPLDLSFSTWFFYLFFKAQQVLAHTGSQVLSAFPYTNEQGLGAWTTLGVLSLWVSRRHLKQAWRNIIGRSSTVENSHEPIPYRYAVLGIFLALTFLVLVLRRAGLPLSLIPFYFGIYFLLSIAITRVRAALGPPFHEVIFTHPQIFMVDVLGTRGLGANNLTLLTFLYPFNRDNSSHPMPNQLEGFKIAERTGISNRHIFWGMVFALILSILVSFWSYMDVMYRNGMTAKARGYIVGIGPETFNMLSSWLQYPREPDHNAVLFIGIGGAFTTLLMIMQRSFIWWPFHAGGYALGASWGMIHVWTSIIVGWALKGIILKYGGLKAYRVGVPFFVGLILGDQVIGCSWSILGAVLGIPTYGVFH